MLEGGNFTGKGNGLGENKRIGRGAGKERRSCLFSLLPLPSIEEADLQPWCWGEVSIRKTDLQFCPLSVWVLSFNSPISINPHLAAHPSSDISSFLSLQARLSDPKWLLKGQSRPFSFPPLIGGGEGSKLVPVYMYAVAILAEASVTQGMGGARVTSPVLCRPPLCPGLCLLPLQAYSKDTAAQELRAGENTWILKHPLPLFLEAQDKECF